MTNKIITISREFGSGGRTIGKKVAEKLAIKCYDAELIGEIAKESGFAEEYVEREAGNKPSYWQGPFFDYNFPIQNNHDIIWNAQRKVILDLAKRESCVIVGRCSDYILRDKFDCLNVFIHADEEKRAERIVNVYGQREEAPKKRIKEKDKKRKAYHDYYTDIVWGDASYYDVCLDSGKLGIDKCVDAIIELYR